MSALRLSQTVRPETALGAGLFRQRLAPTRSSDESAVSRAPASRAGRPAASPGVGDDRPVDSVAFRPEALEAAARLEADRTVVDAQGTRPPDELGSSERNGERTHGQALTDPVDEALDTEAEEGQQKDENIAAPRGADGEPLSDAEVEQLRDLQARDREVRRHELAHVAAGGPYVTSGPTYQYQEGPDGKRYAVGGNVGIDVSAEDTPEETITKARVVRRAALAPAEPSAQDRRVAAQASQLEQQARAELNEQRSEEAQAEAQDDSTDSDPTNGEPRRSAAFDAVA